jgi:uncharacterized coiled-coil protein SlyX
VSLIVTIVIVAIIGVISSVYINNKKQSEIDMLASEKSDLNKMLVQKDSLINDVENTFTEIESKLSFIKEKRNQISLNKSEGGKNRKQALIEDVNLMNTMLEESSKKIAELEEKLRKSGLSIKAYEKRMQELNATIESQNQQIAELKKVIGEKDLNIAQLNTKVQNLDQEMKKQSDTISVKQNIITERTDKLNTAFYTIGTFKALKEGGVLGREGGVLGLGSSKAIQENFDPKRFTEVDIRKLKTIPVNAKKAVFISEHPQGSYKLVEQNDKIASIEIVNPAEFWRISKYAVIEVK